MTDNTLNTFKIFHELAEPIPQHLIKVKTTKYRDKKTNAQKQFSVKHITARTVMNRLDSVVGPQNWRTEFSSEGCPPKTIMCTLFLRINGEWVGKSDIGTATDVEPEKGMVSTAIKRAAVHWGIARELYEEGVADLGDDDAPQPTEAPPARASRPKRSSAPNAPKPAPERDSGDFPTIRKYWPDVASSLLETKIGELPDGLNVGKIIGVQCTELGYKDYDHFKELAELESHKKFKGTLDALLNRALELAPKYAEEE